MADGDEILAEDETAIKLGITKELLFAYARYAPKKNIEAQREVPTRRLPYKLIGKQRGFSAKDLEAWSSYLWEPWALQAEPRLPIPTYIDEYLKVESHGECALCGKGHKLENAHIKDWAISLSHHHHNLIRLCTDCHSKYDDGIITLEVIQRAKDRLIEQTRARLRKDEEASSQEAAESATIFTAPPRPEQRLVGREAMLANSKQLLLTENHPSIAFTGLPGVGKTALALDLVYDDEVQNHFRDGVLWASLGRNGDALSRLSAWGAALGIAESTFASLTTVEALARAIHAAIGSRQMLLVIDDAWQVDTALALRVGGPNCAHLLTSRLPDVALAFAGNAVSTVQEMSEADSVVLLAEFVPQVVEAEPEATRALVRVVGGLPLALTLMGNYLRKEAYRGQHRRVRTALNQLTRRETRLQLSQAQAPLDQHPSLPQGMPLSL